MTQSVTISITSQAGDGQPETVQALFDKALF